MTRLKELYDKWFKREKVPTYWEVEQEYRKESSRRMQVAEDRLWELNIKHCAQEMLNKRNHEKDINRIKALSYPNSEIMQLWANSEPLILVPLMRKSIYEVHDIETAKYIGGNIHDIVLEKYKELRTEYDNRKVENCI